MTSMFLILFFDMSHTRPMAAMSPRNPPRDQVNTEATMSTAGRQPSRFLARGVSMR